MLSFASRLNDPAPILLDGATGTELNRRGVNTALPLWSAAALITAPQVVRQIHAEYVSAGAEIITANTFRTHARNFAAAGLPDLAADSTLRAVKLARHAAGTKALVAGSQAPLEDCYTPQLTPPDDALRREHEQMARNLAAAHVDLILVETMPTSREALAAARAAIATGLPVLVSFVCDEAGRLLSGESLEQAAAAVKELGPQGVLVNCAPAPSLVSSIARLRKVCGELPFGGYANIGRPDPLQGWQNTDAIDPQRYAAYARDWLAAGARFIGGCCGTRPEHIRAMAEMLGRAQG
jgi:S-methylmethionine-dependent homocysteine/selenocysteine methylase